MGETVKAETPRWILIATGVAGLVAALFVAVAKYYEIHKARAEAARAQAELSNPAAASAATGPGAADSTERQLHAPALRAGSVWKGNSTWAQGIAAGTAPKQGSPIALVVAHRSGNAFRGHCSWGSGDKEDVAEVEGQINGDQVTFREFKILKGPASSYPIPCVWTGTISGNRMQGRWMRATSADGTFEFLCQTNE